MDTTDKGDTELPAGTTEQPIDSLTTPGQVEAMSGEAEAPEPEPDAPLCEEPVEEPPVPEDPEPITQVGAVSEELAAAVNDNSKKWGGRLFKYPLRTLYRRLAKKQRPVKSGDVVEALVSGGLDNDAAEQRVGHIVKTYDQAVALCDGDPMAAFVLTVLEDNAYFLKRFEHCISDVAAEFGKKRYEVLKAWKLLCGKGFIQRCFGWYWREGDYGLFELTEPVGVHFRFNLQPRPEHISGLLCLAEGDLKAMPHHEVQKAFKRACMDIPLESLRKNETLLLKRISLCKQEICAQEELCKPIHDRLIALGAEVTQLYSEVSSLRRQKWWPARPDLCPAPKRHVGWSRGPYFDQEGKMVLPQWPEG